MRRSQHDKVSPPNLIPCPSCSAPTLPHRVCGSCGSYKGKQVLGGEPVGEGDVTGTEATEA